MTGKWEDGSLEWCVAFERGSRITASQFSVRRQFSTRTTSRSDIGPVGGDREVLSDWCPAGEPEETLEMFAFMEAADQSKAKGGVAVPLMK